MDVVFLYTLIFQWGPSSQWLIPVHIFQCSNPSLIKLKGQKFSLYFRMNVFFQYTVALQWDPPCYFSCLFSALSFFLPIPRSKIEEKAKEVDFRERERDGATGCAISRRDATQLSLRHLRYRWCLRWRAGG